MRSDAWSPGARRTRPARASGWRDGRACPHSDGEQKLHPLRVSPMDEAAARRSDAAVSDLANTVVAEIPPFVRLNANAALWHNCRRCSGREAGNEGGRQ